MALAEKIRKYGVAGSLRRAPKAVRYRVDSSLYRCEYERFQREPIDERLIVLESEGDLSDNAYALYDYMRQAGYLERYHVVWAVDDLGAARRLKAAEPERWPNTEFVRKYPSGLIMGGVNEECARALATCRWFIYDHNNLMARLPKRDAQTVVYLSHGCGYKAPKGGDTSHDLTPCDVFTSTGQLGSEFLANFIGQPVSKARMTGYPRNDYLFQNNEQLDKLMNERFHLDWYRDCVLWMPTFRQSVAPTLSEDYIQGETGLPLFNNTESLKRLSDFLQSKKMLVILKLHHLQAELPVFNRQFNNVVVLRDDDLESAGLQLYQFIRRSDALISDYSSISVDYLLLDRPIIYTLDDYEEYASARGFFPSDAKNYMPGYHVYDPDELMSALSEIADGIDRHHDDRASLIGNYHAHLDGLSSSRVLKAIGII